jgi:5'-3' exonuclease
MDTLGTVLKGMNANWIVSGVDEFGEGEHKIMRWLRESGTDSSQSKGNSEGKIVIYGLDADLILLSMLVGEQIANSNLYLLREVQEFEKKTVCPGGAQEYQYMDISEFQKRLGIQGYTEVLNYVALMSLMGNDFLPHSITHKLSDGGHDYVVKEFNTLKRTGEWLVSDSDQSCGDQMDQGGQMGQGGQGKVDTTVLQGICRRLSMDEESRFIHMCMKKQSQARNGVLKGMKEEEALPLVWNVEAVFFENGVIRKGWRDVYWSFLQNIDKASLCAEYIKGFQWIIDYYRGIETNQGWMFPAWIPPLWSDLAAHSVGSGISRISVIPHIPEKQEQLAMVLPLESWGLIRNPELRRLPYLAPQLWPAKYGFFSMGRRWLWECEASIPVVTLQKLRHLVR